MTLALVTSATAFSTNNNSATTSALNTTGANLLIVGVASYSALDTVTDSKGNTWFPLTSVLSIDRYFQLFYAKKPIVGAGHTFTATGTTTYPSLAVHAFSGASADPFDVQNTNSVGSGVTCQPGSVTPSANGAAVVTGCQHIGTAPTISAPYTLIAVANGANNVGSAHAYSIQTTAAATNPTHGWAGNSNCAAAIAAFKAGELLLDMALQDDTPSVAVVDSSPFSNTGALQFSNSSVYSCPGPGGIYPKGFAGEDMAVDWIAIGSGIGLAGDFTIQWFNKFDSISHEGGVCTDSLDNFAIYFTTDLTLIFTDGTATSEYDPNLQTGRWHHFALVRQSGTVILYVDGEQVSTAMGGTSSAAITVNFLMQYIGTTTEARAAGYKIYATARTQEQIIADAVSGGIGGGSASTNHRGLNLGLRLGM